MGTERTQSRAASSTASVAVVYIVSLTLCVCSLLYELLIAQTLTLIAGNMCVPRYRKALLVGAIARSG
ncbi:MAG: hypothetical protein ACE5NA_07880 [Nitrospiraceae bacterium]